jgi:streptogramin lyase
MSLLELCLFTLAATLAGSTTAGMLNVQIQEYEVPTPKSRPHDPALAPDGSLWYTGQGANKLGRLDPKTGEFKEYSLKTPDSGPHGLVADTTSGSPRSPKGTSASLIRRLERSRNIARPMAPKSTLTRPSSIRMAFFGLPTKRPTISAGSIRSPARWS